MYRRRLENKSLNKGFCLAVTAFLILLVLPTVAVSAQQQDGASEPTEISNVQELQNISEDLNGSYVLVDDIDATGTEDWNGGDGFEPIGACGEFRNESISCVETPFTGTLDGNGHTVTGLTVNRTDEDEVGLFGVLGNGTVSDIELEDIEVAGGDFARVGGLVGLNLGQIKGAGVSGSVNGENFNVGGLTGANVGVVNHSSADVNVSGGAAVGGLVGNNGGGGEVLRSYAEGEVTAEKRAGGLLGKNTGLVSDSYATGDVTTQEGQTGGLVGANQNEGEIVASYAVGTPDTSGFDSNSTGGLVGRLGGGIRGDIGSEAPQREGEVASIRDSYWDTEATSRGEAVGKEAPGLGNVTVENVEGLTTEEMRGTSPRETMQALDFTGVWGTVTDPDGYPRHRWSTPQEQTEKAQQDEENTESGSGATEDQTAGNENEGMPGFGVVAFLTGVLSVGLTRSRLRPR